MKQIITLALLMFIAISLQAQNDPAKRRSVDLSLGWQKFTFLDKHASPLAYSTNSIFPNVGLAFRRQTPVSDFQIGLSGTIGNMAPVRFGVRGYETKFDDSTSFHYNAASQFYHVNLNAAYYRKLQSASNDKLTYWAGGVISDAAYYTDAIANQPYFLNAMDLSPSVKVDYTPFRQHSFGLRIDIAVLGLIARMPYYWFPKTTHGNNATAFFEQGTHVNTLNRFQKINWQLAYQYQAAKHFAIGASYAAKWMTYSHLKKLEATDNHFDIHFLYTY